MALWYIGGLLKHARALSAIIAPTTNSYKRLVPGYEAPVNLAYSRRNRRRRAHSDVFGQPEGEARRVPAAGSVGESVSGVCGDADGGPGRRAEQDRSGRAAGQGHLRSVAGGDEEGSVHAGVARRSAGCLEDDHAFLLKGDVFTEELIETFINYKRKNEADAIRLRPHPYEFALYYDI